MRREIGLFLLFLIAGAYFEHPVEYDNTSSRWYLLSSLVDFKTLNIDRYRSETIDTATAGGHVYSSKSIGPSLAAAPFYWALRRAAGADSLSPTARYLCRFFTTTIPYALACAAMFGLLLAMGCGARSAFDAVLIYGLGTLAWIHASLFSGHQMAASFSLFSFALLYRKLGLQAAFAAGVMAGMAGLCDYIAIYAAGVLSLYALKKRGGAAFGFFCGGASLAAAVLGVYNWICFGSPWSASYANLGYGAFSAGASQGLLGIGVPKLMPLLQLLFSPARGLFFIAPALALAFSGFADFKKRHPPEALAAAAIVLGTILINAGFYGWHGGMSFGPRYLVCVLPFLALPIAFSRERLWRAPLFIVSLAQIAAAQIALPHAPEITVNPIVECFIPLLAYGYGSRNLGMLLGLEGFASLLPLAAAAGALIWAIRPAREEAPARPAAGISWNAVYGAWLLMIFSALAFVRTKDASVIHKQNAVLLLRAAEVTGSPALRRAAEAEYRGN